MNKIVVACDSFKGSLSAKEACNTIREAILLRAPTSIVEVVPMADGGEGSAFIIAEAIGATERIVTTQGADLQPIEASYYIKDKLAIIEIASCCSLTMSKTNKYNPETLLTNGFGIMMSDAIKQGCNELILCLGGSSTSDGGLGLLYELGVKFYNHKEEILDCKLENMNLLDHIDIQDALGLLEGVQIQVATDVRNVYIGKQGAVHTFGPQKGLDATAINRMEQSLVNINDAIYKSYHIELSKITSSGAAGGLGGALYLLGAKLVSGIELIIKYTNLEAKCEGASLVISGEGRIDNQTMQGKVISGIAKLAKSKGIPMIAFGGQVSDDSSKLYDIGVNAVYEIAKPHQSFEEQLKFAKENLFARVCELIDEYIEVS